MNKKYSQELLLEFYLIFFFFAHTLLSSQLRWALSGKGWENTHASPVGLNFQAPKLAVWMVLINNVNLYVLTSGKNCVN